MDRAFAGDPEAFSEIVHRYQRPVLGLCARLLRGEDARDLAQETFLRAFVNAERFDRDRPVLPWLLTIAKHLCLDRLRVSKRELPESPSTPVPLDEAPDAEREVSAKRELGRLEEALFELPESQREVIAMYHLDGLSYREISETLEVPVGTVMTWLHRGRNRLRELMAAGERVVPLRAVAGEERR